MEAHFDCCGRPVAADQAEDWKADRFVCALMQWEPDGMGGSRPEIERVSVCPSCQELLAPIIARGDDEVRAWLDQKSDPPPSLLTSIAVLAGGRIRSWFGR